MNFFNRLVPRWHVLVFGGLLSLLTLSIFIFLAARHQEQTVRQTESLVEVDTQAKSTYQINLILKDTGGGKIICRAKVPLWYLSNSGDLELPMMSLSFTGCPKNVIFENVELFKLEEGGTLLTFMFGGRKIGLRVVGETIEVLNPKQLARQGIQVTIE